MKILDKYMGLFYYIRQTIHIAKGQSRRKAVTQSYGSTAERPR